MEKIREAIAILEAEVKAEETLKLQIKQEFGITDSAYIEQKKIINSFIYTIEILKSIEKTEKLPENKEIVEEKNNIRNFKFGAIVIIKKGFYSNCTGIIIDYNTVPDSRSLNSINIKEKIVYEIEIPYTCKGDKTIKIWENGDNITIDQN